MSNYLKYCEIQKRLDAKTLKAYKIDLTQFMREINTENFIDITPSMLENFIANLHRKYKPKTVKRKIASIKALFHYFEYRDLIEKNPFNKLQIKFRESITLPKIIPLNYIEAILSTIYDYKGSAKTKFQQKNALRDVAVIELLFATGMRIGELLALTYEDIDLEKRCITINKSYQRLNGKDMITPPKTPKSNRQISIPPFLAEELKEYCSMLYGITANERMFRFTKSFMEHEMVRGIKETGVRRIRLHDLRHSHASLLVEMGFQPLAIAERLGHEKIETTLNTYSHLYPNKQAELAEKLEIANGEE